MISSRHRRPHPLGGPRRRTQATLFAAATVYATTAILDIAVHPTTQHGLRSWHEYAFTALLVHSRWPRSRHWPSCTPCSAAPATRLGARASALRQSGWRYSSSTQA